MSSLSVCMVVHNEEAVIERALRSIQTVADEILIVHDGPCGDSTIQICKKYNAQVFTKEYIGEAEPHRVWLLKKATKKWILQIDADEYLSKKLQNVIKSLISSEDISCYEFIWPYWKRDHYQTKHWPTKKALFHKDSIHFLGFPHEEVRIIKGRLSKTQYILEHRPSYDNYTYASFKKKWRKWVDIHARYIMSPYTQLERFPSDSIEELPHYWSISQKPIQSLLYIPFLHFFGSYILGGWKEGRAGFTISAMTGWYYACICMKVWKLKGKV